MGTKKLCGLVLFYLALILALPGTAIAAPYLTCDCTQAVDAVTGFQIQIGAQAPLDLPVFTICEAETPCIAPSYRMCWDAAQLPAGPFSIKALAKNAWGVSNWTSPLAGSKTLPSSPSFLKIVQ